MNSGAKERLGGVDITQPDDRPAVHQERLDRRLAAARRGGESGTGELGPQRLHSQAGEMAIVLETLRRGGEDQAEAAWVAQPQAFAAIE